MEQRHLPAIPPDWEQYLTDDQIWGLNSARSFGVELFFIRRPEHGEVLVMAQQDGKTALLQPDGTLDYHHVIHIREPDQ